MEHDTARDKPTLRAEMRERLKQLSPQDIAAKSAAACRRVMAMELFERAQAVMMYLPMPHEVDPTAIALRCFQTRRTVCVPRVDWARGRMTALEIRDFESGFEERRPGVREPRGGRPLALEEIDLILVPGLAFDAEGRRLGRGGGFYDRFLTLRLCPDRPGQRCWSACGLCFDLQVIDRVPADAHDVRLDAVATDRRLLCPSRGAAPGRPTP